MPTNFNKPILINMSENTWYGGKILCFRYTYVGCFRHFQAWVDPQKWINLKAEA